LCGFEFFAQRIGLQDYDGLQLGSPFDYERNVTVYVEKDLLVNCTISGESAPVTVTLITYFGSETDQHIILTNVVDSVSEEMTLSKGDGEYSLVIISTDAAGSGPLSLTAWVVAPTTAVADLRISARSDGWSQVRRSDLVMIGKSNQSHQRKQKRRRASSGTAVQVGALFTDEAPSVVSIQSRVPQVCIDAFPQCVHVENHPSGLGRDEARVRGPVHHLRDTQPISARPTLGRVEACADDRGVANRCFHRHGREY